MSFNHPTQLRKFMKVGTVWSRVNHQYPDQVGGEVVTEKGTPVQVRVHKVDKEGVALEILDRPGTISFLSWPNSLYMQMFTEPNEIRIENRYGPLLTYTRMDTPTQEAQQLVDALLDENTDSFEGGKESNPNFRAQVPRQPTWHPGHGSSRRLLKMNNRRAGFGFTDRDSMRDRQWPLVNRGYDRRMKKYQRDLAHFGQVDPGGEGV